MRVKHMLKRLGLAVAALVLLTVITLAIVGVPAPWAATTSNVPRLSWGLAWHVAMQAKRPLDGASFSTWDPRGGIVVQSIHRLTPVPHGVASPGAEPVPLPLPSRTASLRFNPDPNLGYAVFTRDEGGNEDYQIHRWDLDTGEKVLLTDGESRNRLGRFTRDGTLLAFSSTRRNGKDADIYVVDPRKPQSVRLVAEADGGWSPTDWSPRGERLLVVDTPSSAESRPYLLTLPTGAVEPLVDLEPKASFGNVRWGPDEDTVFVVTDRGSEFKRLMRVDLSTGTMWPHGPDFGWDVVGFSLPDDHSQLLVHTNEDGYPRYHIVDAVTGESTEVNFPAGHVAGASFRPDGAAIGLTLVGTDAARSAWTYDVAARTATRWTGAPKPEEAPLPEARLFRYRSFDELEIPAFVWDPPPDAPRPAPVLVKIHGGPVGQSGPAPNTTYDVARRRHGLAVITPNVRGSAGYGKTYTTLDDGYLREDAVRDIGALLDWIAARPEYDANRVIVYGASYGGYMVLASMFHFPDRIRCGVDVVGISNFVTFLENTKPYRRDHRRAEYGDERDPQMRKFLASISPANNAEKITGRLVIIQGENDPRVPVTESRQMVDRLRHLGREVWYVEFDNEGHGVRLPLNAGYAGLVGLTFAERCIQR